MATQTPTHCPVFLKLCDNFSLVSENWVAWSKNKTTLNFSKTPTTAENVDAANQCLINHKPVRGALNRHFCQTAVSGWASFFSHFLLLGSKNPPMVLSS